MAPRVKIVTAGINIICLVATLIYPDNVTPYVLLMTIVSAAAWAITSNDEFPQYQIGLNAYTALSTLVGGICILLGVTANITAVPQNATTNSIQSEQIVDHYLIRFHNKTFMLGGTEVSYTPVAIGLFVVIVALMVIELIYSMRTYGRTTAYSHSIASFINRKTNHIR